MAASPTLLLLLLLLCSHASCAPVATATHTGVHIPPEGLPSFKKGDLLAVCVHGNPAPLALGWAGMSSTDAVQRKGGKLVEVVQV